MSKGFINRWVRWAPVVVTAFVFGGVAAQAVIPPSSNDIIDACFNNNRGTLRLVIDPADSCNPDRETTIQILGAFAKAADSQQLGGHPASYFVNASNLASGTVPTDRLGDGSITNSKLVNPSLTLSAGAGLAGGGTVALGQSVTISNSGVISVGASAPLVSSGGQNPLISLGVVPAANGGTGLSVVGPAGNYLRSSGSSWASSQMQAADVPADSTFYIRNSTSPQTASFNVTGTATVTGNAVVGGNLSVGAATSASRLTVGGAIESTSIGFRFPDGTLQATAATTGAFLHSATYIREHTTEGSGLVPNLGADLSCEAGDLLLSGGLAGVDVGTHIQTSAPTSPDTWFAFWTNDATLDSITIRIICADQ